MKTIHVIVTGLVQGVGFRPFVFRLATRYRLKGWVQNTSENVRIMVTGEEHTLADFVTALRHEAPPASKIDKISVEYPPLEVFSSFDIIESRNIEGEITEISPDIAVCAECLADMDAPGNRMNYAFVNCTNCGPRFSIIRDLPYDRQKTTMQTFLMCNNCRSEYRDIFDRRFHAQPVACIICGPEYELYAEGRVVTRAMNEVLPAVSELIDSGGIMLMKGLGGMHLACDAFNPASVKRLRSLKKRDGKPFAVMFRDIETIKNSALVNQTEESSLTSWRRPIVLVQQRAGHERPLPEEVNAGLNLVGAMLPYLPFHYLLFHELQTDAIILTSGNLSQEPILIENGKALEMFSAKVDMILLHNRDIYNRTDDSVVRIMNGKERLLRRSRGYVPEPVRTPHLVDGIIAFGAELTNCFCVGKGKKAFISQHIGDLQGIETTRFYEETVDRFIDLFRVVPSLLAVDLHPDYISTRSSVRFSGLPVISVQHHHAHVASCMAEHDLNEQVIGVAMDGTGLGDDGNIWGSEFFVCDLESYERIAHFEYLPLPGGDRAVEEPWRLAVAWLYKVFGEKIYDLDVPVLKLVDRSKTDFICRMIDRGINVPLTCGAGRYFDAVSSLVNLCQYASFQAEGPMRLEAMVNHHIHEAYSFISGRSVNLDPALEELLADLNAGKGVDIISAKFHNTIISAIFETVCAIRGERDLNKVVLSGGVFQNRYLLENTENILRTHGFEVFTHAMIPPNDAGVALGQMVVASKKRG